MVLGAHQQPPSLLVQQEGVVARAVGQAVKGDQVAGLQHLCRRSGKKIGLETAGSSQRLGEANKKKQKKDFSSFYTHQQNVSAARPNQGDAQPCDWTGNSHGILGKGGGGGGGGCCV